MNKLSDFNIKKGSRSVLLVHQVPILAFGLTQLLLQLEDVEVFESSTVPQKEEIKITPDYVFLINFDWADEILIQRVVKVYAEFSDAIVVVIDLLLSTDRLKACVKNGAKGYLSQYCTESDLLKCLTHTDNGKQYVDAESMFFLLNSLEQNSKERVTRKNQNRLTSRENEIASLLVSGKKVTTIARGLKRKVSTISTIKKNIFRKMQVDNIVDLREQMHLFQ